MTEFDDTYAAWKESEAAVIAAASTWEIWGSDGRRRDRHGRDAEEALRAAVIAWRAALDACNEAWPS